MSLGLRYKLLLILIVLIGSGIVTLVGMSIGNSDIIINGKKGFSVSSDNISKNMTSTKHMERRPGPRIWTALTNHWGDGTAAPKKGGFPGYYDPVPNTGFIKEHKSKSRVTVGSALAVHPNGVWLTAKHVIKGCKKIYLQGGFSQGKLVNLKPINITRHPTADVAVISTQKNDHDREPFKLRVTGDQAGDAFHIGFPGGKPGAIHSRFLGRMHVRRVTRHKKAEEVLVWAEASRIPDLRGSLGGMSGGPVVDRTGALIGISSAASVRRGRILTSLPTTLADTIRQSGNHPNKVRRKRKNIFELTPNRFPTYASAVIQDRRAIRVICRKTI
ncbi:MAG: serine protease [Pseudomonadota bacterium]|nr:serine protease [Pseudomonadota bacterium]